MYKEMHTIRIKKISDLLFPLYGTIYNLLAIYLLCAGNIPDADACAATC